MLEKAELRYKLKLVDIGKSEQGTAAHEAVSALGKVPSLSPDGEPVLENGAIITLIQALRPEADVLSRDDSPRTRAEGVDGLSFLRRNSTSDRVRPRQSRAADRGRRRAGARTLARAGGQVVRLYARTHRRARLVLGEVAIVDVYLDRAFGGRAQGGVRG